MVHVNAINRSVANATHRMLPGGRTSKVTRNEMLVNAINRSVANATQARTSKATRNEMMSMLRMMAIIHITTITTMTFANNTAIITQRLPICQPWLLSTTITRLSTAHHLISSNTDPDQPPKHQTRNRQMRRRRNPGRKNNNNGLYAAPIRADEDPP